MAKLVVGLNPALQRRVVLEELVVGEVNRARSVSVGVGGKGQNVIIASSCMQLKDRKTVLLQLLGGGAEGHFVESQLNSLGFGELLTVITKGRCRTCITIIDQSHIQSTEIVEPADMIDEEERLHLLDMVSQNFSTEKVAVIAVMGSLPPGLSPSTYAELISVSCTPKSKVILDTCIDLLRTICAAIAHGCQVLVKINASELCRSICDGQTAQSIPDQALQLSSEVCRLCDFPITEVRMRLSYAITDGPKPVTLCTGDTHFRISVSGDHIPVVNPIGAGDAMAAGVLQAWSDSVDLPSDLDATLAAAGISCDGMGLVRAVSWGVACGTASCATVNNSELEMVRALSYYSRIRVCSG